MRTLTITAAALAAITSLPAQSRQVSAVFVGRFDFVSLDQPNERQGGSITALREYDLSAVTPGRGAVARPWLPAAGHGAIQGDARNANDYTRYYQINPNGARWDFCGPFVKFADMGRPDAPIYWTTRDNQVNFSFEVFTTNGTQVRKIEPGDFFRWDHNGNVEFFVTRAILKDAVGVDPQQRAENYGASAICQDDKGNLYVSPEEGGTWVTGNDPTAGPMWCSRAGIIMIDAKDITYDANGNVAAITKDVGHIIFGGYAQPGPNGQPSITDMVGNAGAYDYQGNPITITNAASYYNTVGLALDPLGGTIQASVPRGPASQPIYDIVPNFVFCSDNGTHACTVFSTRIDPNNLKPGTIAVLNGVKCGSDQMSVPATGAWFGVQQDVPNFRPTPMGFCLIDQLDYEPFVIDAPNDGAILATDNDILVDMYAGPLVPVFLVMAVGPFGPGKFQPAVDIGPVFGPRSFDHFYGLTVPNIVLAVGATDANGYATFKTANPKNPGHKGAVLEFQGVKPTGGNPAYAFSNPIALQFK